MTAPLDPFKRGDRDVACQDDLEPEFKALAEWGERKGWRGDEAANALLALAIAHIKARVGAAAASHAIKRNSNNPQALDGRGW